MNCKEISSYLDVFDTVSLEELDSQNLLDRFDTKFIVEQHKIPMILEALENDYKTLDINGIRCFKYYNLYFDTSDYMFYNQHHNGKLNRSKIRYRNYVDSNLFFFEIKRRSNNSQTIKDRIQTSSVERKIGGEAGELVSNLLSINSDLLIPKLNDNYQRITLLNQDIQEKITIDLDLTFKNTVNFKALPGIALIEIKQKKLCQCTKSMELLKRLSIKPANSLSKYCIGMVVTDSIEKYNRFKPTVLIINKLMKEEYGFKFFDEYSFN